MRASPRFGEPPQWAFRLLFLAAPAPAMLRVLASRHALGGGDLGLLFYPFWDYLARSLRQGRLPLWDPVMAGGLPFLANLQTQVFYPPTALAVALLPLHAAAFALLFGHLYWAALGTERLAKGLGLEPRTALCAGALVGGAPILVAAMVRPNLLMATAWLPWTLLAGDRACRGLSRGLAALAVCVGLGLLCGQPEVTLLAAASVAALSVWRAARGNPSAVPRCALAGLLGVALAAASLLPFAELVSHSTRAGELRGMEGAWSLGRGDLASLLLPFLNADLPWQDFREIFYGPYQQLLSVVYLGAPAVMLAAFAVARGGRRERGLVAAAIGSLLLAAWAGLGTLALERWRLGFLGFRYPIKLVCALPFTVALLAALGAARASTAATRGASKGLAIAGALLLPVPVVWLPRLGQLPALSIAWLAGGLLVLSALLRWVRAGAWRQWALVGFCALETGLCALRVPFEDDSEPCPAIYAAIAARLGTGRLDAVSGTPLGGGGGMLKPEPGLANDCLVGNGDAQFGLPSLRFYGTPEPAYPDAAAASKLPHVVWDGLLGATLLLRSAPKPAPGLVPIEAPELAPLWAAVLPEAAPRAELRPSARASEALGSDLAAETLERARREVVLDAPPPPPSPAGAAYEGPDAARVLADEGERVVVETASPSERWLVLSDLHYPGWRAEVDGVLEPIVVAYGMIRALRLGPGRHQIVFDYRPRSFRLGVWISSLALLLLLAFGSRRSATKGGRAPGPTEIDAPGARP